MNESKTNQLIQNRNAKIDELKAAGIPLYPNGFKITHTVADIQTVLPAADAAPEAPAAPVAAAGRIMALPPERRVFAR